MLARISAVLAETLMGFLALAALGFGLAPQLFALPPGVERAFELAQWLIVALYGVEFAVNFALAGDRRGYLRSPWRLLDLAIIAAALLSLLPAVSDAALSSPALRILRLFRILLFGPRIGHGLHHPDVPAGHPAPDGPPQVSILRPGAAAPVRGEWSGLLGWAAAPTSDWLHASNLAPERLKEVAVPLGVPRVLIEAALHEASFPRLESGPRWTALTVSLPTLGERPHRDPLLLLVSETDLLTLTPHPLDLQQAPGDEDTLPWGPRCALQIIRLVLARNEEMAGLLERRVRQLEELPASESPESFFSQTSRMKRILSTAKGDLWRLRGLLEMLADGRRHLPGLGEAQRPMVSQLAEEADYLYETIDNVREAVVSLVELHIDIASHETNRFMRLLAVVSTMALIPALAGGLLGMNLAEGPWPVTLGQIGFGTLMLGLGVLYTFMAKGWLR